MEQPSSESYLWNNPHQKVISETRNNHRKGYSRNTSCALRNVHAEKRRAH
jgi:hypothetical protein